MPVLGSGSILSDRYRLDERVATGGMGDVWRATDLVLARQVAVKVLLPSLLIDPTFIARFRAEARMMAALHHPGIVQVYDSGTDSTSADNADYLVMEFVDGEPLSRRIDSAGALSVAETLSVVEQVAGALHAAHGNGIVHRDVKPSNLLVQPDGSVVLVDFGVARSTTVTSVTSTNAVPGTALYMAPEQAAGKPVSPATDLYALGAVAFCCLTGNPPFVGESPLEVAVRHLHDEPPALPAEVPAAVADLVYRALAKDPEQRFTSGAAMAAAARAAASGTAPIDEFGTDRTGATAATVLGGAAADAGTMAGAGTVAGAGRSVGRTTQHDLPAVPAGAPVAARAPRSRRRAVVGALAAVVLGLAGLAAALAFAPGTDPSVGGSTPAPAVTTANGGDVPAPEVTGRTEVVLPGSGGATRPSATPTAGRTPTRSATAKPTKSAVATSAPAASTSPTATSSPPSSPASSPAAEPTSTSGGEAQ